MVSVLAFYFDDPSSNPAEANAVFSVKLFGFEKNKNSPVKKIDRIRTGVSANFTTATAITRQLLNWVTILTSLL